MRPAAFHLTTRGASHIRKDKECQDDSFNTADDRYAIIIVCDGHGGDDYVRSARGSKAACAAAYECIGTFLRDADSDELKQNANRMINRLKASIIALWNERIHNDYESSPFTETELEVLSEKARKRYLEGKIESAYGTTMIAVVLAQDYWFGIHIGDGKCVAVNRSGAFSQPIPWDPACFLNQTTSMCDFDALDHFRHYFSEEVPAAVFIGSDGVDDCFSGDQPLYDFYRTVLYSYATSEDKKAAVQELADYLPRLSAQASGDDISIAAAMDLDVIGELSIVREFDREKEKARVEEGKRQEAERVAEEKRRIDAEYERKQKKNSMAPRREKRSGVQRFCESCGARLGAGAKFCGECGRAIPSPEERASELDSDGYTTVITTTEMLAEPPRALEMPQVSANAKAEIVDNGSDVSDEQNVTEPKPISTENLATEDAVSGEDKDCADVGGEAPLATGEG